MRPVYKEQERELKTLGKKEKKGRWKGVEKNAGREAGKSHHIWWLTGSKD